MYMTGQTLGDPIIESFSLAKDLLIGKDQIFVVDDSRLVLKKVTIVGEKGDQVIVQGLADGTLILGENWADAREGLEIPTGKKSQKIPKNKTSNSSLVK
jgi:hypothetical protein